MAASGDQSNVRRSGKRDTWVSSCAGPAPRLGESGAGARTWDLIAAYWPLTIRLLEATQPR